MLLTSATFIRPTATVITFQSREFHKPIRMFATKLDFKSQKSSFCVCNCRDRSQNKMIDPIRIPTFTSGDGVEGFEREDSVQGSANFGAGGIEATLNQLSKWVVSVFFMALILWRHDAETTWVAVGVALNTTLSVALKFMLNQERPTSTLRADPGMPSSHAQSIFYAVAFINMSMVECYGINALTAALGALVFAIGSYFSWLRVSQQFHTISQVAVGAVLGSIFSIFWYWLWNAFVLKAFISYSWVRILIVMGSIGYIIGFIVFGFMHSILRE
ncbi:lipid phosphate phosphatase epsilon 1, chloroplastic-like [Olea europaea var. sylvestris]|uniref:lipid phosphate phosphatase epsilon 1, chloroplastic-like n=1 Tax=Olea europaea var. sylvestris TaxID=158386 RepID=UPI000C1CE380|nr:lipid phosphate phosphatase epsilon 1, chloroplastic-like [Olea europaea var. sylvestris]